MKLRKRYFLTIDYFIVQGEKMEGLLEDTRLVRDLLAYGKAEEITDLHVGDNFVFVGYETNPGVFKVVEIGQEVKCTQLISYKHYIFPLSDQYGKIIKLDSAMDTVYVDPAMNKESKNLQRGFLSDYLKKIKKFT